MDDEEIKHELQKGYSREKKAKNPVICEKKEKEMSR